MESRFRYAFPVALLGAWAARAQAADLDSYVLRGAETPYQNSYGAGLMNEETEFGLRAWVSSGKLEKTINGSAGSGVGAISRLRYDGMVGYSGEVYGRVGIAGWSFFKGSASLGVMPKGNLQDEDFEPVKVPYSSTQSAQRKGDLDYATLDYGVDVLRDPTYRLAFFIGGNYLKETANGYGCEQTATNPDICSPGQVASNQLANTENSHWYSARVGLSGDVLLSNRLRLGVDAAWVPYVSVGGVDTHWLRTNNGPTDEQGHGSNGAQLEATADYRVTDNVSIGAGVRYWRMTAHVNSTFTDPSGDYLSIEPTQFLTQRLGAFVQASYRFK